VANLYPAPVLGTDYFDINAKFMPRLGPSGADFNTGTPLGIEVMTVYGGLLYIANGGASLINQDGGIVRSIGPNPRDAMTFRGTGRMSRILQETGII